MQVMAVRPSLPESIERQAHDADVPRFLLDLDPSRAPGLGEALGTRLQRFIGVIYRPDTERWSHYADAEIARQYDAYVWFDRTTALTPLPGGDDSVGDDTWPFGL